MKILGLILSLTLSLEANAMIYHLITAKNLKAYTKGSEIFNPSLATEGFIHASTSTQVIAAANRHYKGERDTLYALAIDETRLTSLFRYDYVERHKQSFPHVYGPINLSAVISKIEIPKDEDGVYHKPINIPEDPCPSCPGLF